MRRSIPCHPLLAATTPVLLLFSANVDEVTLSALVRPLYIALASAVVVWAVLAAVLRSIERAALMTSALILLFAVGAPALSDIVRITCAPAVTHPIIAVAWAILVWIVLSTLVKTPAVQTASDVLNYVAASLALVPIISAGYVVMTRLETPPVHQLGLSQNSEVLHALPDIYYIIPDGYARTDVLRRLYDYDNTAFTAKLEELGFTVIEQATANYCQTALSLASSLNMSYLVADDGLDECDSRIPLEDAIDRSEVARHLRSAGYTTIAYGSGYSYTEMRSADIYHMPTLSEFERALVLKLLPFHRRKIDICARAHRRNVLRTLSRLGTERVRQEPVFVFAHIVSPHPPFLFDADGGMRPPGTCSLTDGSHRIPAIQTVEEYREQYIAQLEYVNEEILRAVSRIKAASSEDCVIIIQADHGPGSALRWEDPSSTDMQERMAILSAYHLPQDISRELYDSITPVNSFRLLMTFYLGLDLPLLEDRAHFSRWSRPYQFVDVTQNTSQDTSPQRPPPEVTASAR